MVECFKCNGTGQSIREEWDRQWDRYDQNSPSHYDTNLWMNSSGIEKYEVCPVCNGSKELEKVNNVYQLDNKQVTIKQFYNSGIQEYVLLNFEDGTFAKVPLKSIEYFKKN